MTFAWHACQVPHASVITGIFFISSITKTHLYMGRQPIELLLKFKSIYCFIGNKFGRYACHS
ncbi:Hypothetical protein HEAR2570 [Herminiimonas arsenicoxydans]|uniref:Uncharacterized protein n=1 Tax=Herminiimonas arsenicoxydans TaxID=204773 RepID=A4G855_HERAR|nr:Hypothetical protein HEAR2570 [Herminiimonas arsenicoxydans]